MLMGLRVSILQTFHKLLRLVWDFCAVAPHTVRFVPCDDKTNIYKMLNAKCLMVQRLMTVNIDITCIPCRLVAEAGALVREWSTSTA